MSVARKLKAQPQTKTYHATMLVSVDIVDHQKAIWALAPTVSQCPFTATSFPAGPFRSAVQAPYAQTLSPSRRRSREHGER